MTKKISLFLGILMLAGAMIAPQASALTASTDTTANTTVVADDQTRPLPPPVRYAQLNNLVVAAIAMPTVDSSGAQSYAFIEAYSHPCGTLEGMYPCQDVLRRQYTIAVSNQTRLLDVNRKPISIAQIKAGDRINAYGAMRDETNMDASVVRNLRSASTATATQLNNLVIESIAQVASVQGGAGFAPGTGGTYAHIQAYKDNCPQAAGIYCKMPRTQYHIMVNTKTSLLGVNRKPVDLSHFAAGDRINVYGMLHGTDMEAMVIRSLEPGSRTVQLENLRVTSVKEASDGTLSIDAYNGSGIGCYEFFNERRGQITCPVSDVAANAEVARPVYQYRIIVPPSAQVIDTGRRPIKYSAIRVGSVINVYGSMAKDKFTVTAKVVRVMQQGTATTLEIKGPATISAQARTFSSTSFMGIGGTEPLKWEIVDGSLPEGMYLTTDFPSNCSSELACPQYLPYSLNTAWIAGTPTRAGSYRVVLTVRDANGLAANKHEVTITVARRQL